MTLSVDLLRMDAIDSESREILTMSRSRSVQLNVSQPVVIGHLH